MALILERLLYLSIRFSRAAWSILRGWSCDAGNEARDDQPQAIVTKQVEGNNTKSLWLNGLGIQDCV